MRFAIIAVLFMIGSLYPSDGYSDHATVPAYDTLQNIKREFISGCSGVAVTNVHAYVQAYAICLGRIQGTYETHISTIRKLSNYLDMRAYDVQLWCPPTNRNLTHVNLLHVALDWVESNENVVMDINNRFPIHEAAIIIMYKSLASKFPC